MSCWILSIKLFPKCECCNSDENIEAHERWEYDDKKLIQKLVRLVALCKKCHEATHMGRARVIGKGEKAKLHLKNVRQFTDKQCKKHINNAFNKWRKRSQKNWDLDLSLLTSNGIKLQKKVNKKERKTISENKINKKVRISRPCYFCQKSDVGTTCETSAFRCEDCGFRDMHNDCYEMNAMQCPMCKKQNVFYISLNKNKKKRKTISFIDDSDDEDKSVEEATKQMKGFGLLNLHFLLYYYYVQIPFAISHTIREETAEYPGTLSVLLR